MKCRNDAGFSLVEVMVAIVILGLITVPVTSGMLVAMKTMARTEEMMRAQMAVSSAVEELMADGISEASNDYRAAEFPDVTVVTSQDSPELPYYNVRVVSDVDDTVVVNTVIRKAGGGQ